MITVVSPRGITLYIFAFCQFINYPSYIIVKIQFINYYKDSQICTKRLLYVLTGWLIHELGIPLPWYISLNKVHVYVLCDCMLFNEIA